MKYYKNKYVLIVYIFSNKLLIPGIMLEALEVYSGLYSLS